MKSFIQYITETAGSSPTTLGNWNPATKQVVPGMHQFDDQGNIVRTYSDGTPSPTPQPNNSSVSVEDRIRSQLAQHLQAQKLKSKPNSVRPLEDRTVRTRDTDKLKPKDSLLAARFPEAFPEQPFETFENPDTGDKSVWQVTAQRDVDVDVTPEGLADRLSAWAETGGDTQEFNKQYHGNPWDTSYSYTINSELQKIKEMFSPKTTEPPVDHPDYEGVDKKGQHVYRAGVGTDGVVDSFFSVGKIEHYGKEYPNAVEAEFRVNDSWKKNDTNRNIDPREVFRAVHSHFDHFIRTHGPSAIFYDTADPTRHRIYQMAAKKYGIPAINYTKIDSKTGNKK